MLFCIIFAFSLNSLELLIFEILKIGTDKYYNYYYNIYNNYNLNKILKVTDNKSGF